MKPIFYHTLTCPQCKAVEMLFKKKKIEVESCTDVDLMKSKGITHTPALEVDGKILQGKAIFNFANTYKGE